MYVYVNICIFIFFKIISVFYYFELMYLLLFELYLFVLISLFYFKIWDSLCLDFKVEYCS